MFFFCVSINAVQKYVLFLTLEKTSKEVMYHTICVNYEAKIEAGAGPE